MCVCLHVYKHIKKTLLLVIALAYCPFGGLIASIVLMCKSLWIKVSAK